MWNIGVALGCSIAAVVVGYAVLRDLHTGESGDSMYRYNAADNPLGYPMMIATKVFAVVFFIAEALYALHWIGEPMGLARNLLKSMIAPP